MTNVAVFLMNLLADLQFSVCGNQEKTFSRFKANLNYSLSFCVFEFRYFSKVCF